MRIDHRVKGIPCQIDITHYHHAPPWGGPRHLCDTDWDYYGYTEVEFDILDRKGRPAPWLEAKLSNDDRINLEAEIIEYIQGDDDE